MAETDWLRAILLQGIQRQQAQANTSAGYAISRPPQVLMDWVKTWITAQEKEKMEVLNEPKETEAP